MQAHRRRFFSCGRCGLVSVHPADRPSAAEERAHYATHENDVADARYRAFLDRLARPLVARLPAGASGLDVGCGPAPALAQLLAARGFPTAVYDPLFAPDLAPLGRAYAFVTCTETAEHFHHPARDWARLFALVRPGGVLAVMTGVLDEERDARGRFAAWRYARDPTHVAFYRPQTLVWLARRAGWGLCRPERHVAFFTRPASARPVARGEALS
ncbi:MAG: class I SAM-dependent methyltransferase [Rubricoccaceae bacterium]